MCLVSCRARVQAEMFHPVENTQTSKILYSKLDKDLGDVFELQ